MPPQQGLRNCAGRVWPKYQYGAWAAVGGSWKLSTATAARGPKRSRSSTFTYTKAAAIVGNIESRGQGPEEQPHALAYTPGTPMRSADAPREPVPVASDAEREMPDSRRNFTGRVEGE